MRKVEVDKWMQENVPFNIRYKFVRAFYEKYTGLVNMNLCNWQEFEELECEEMLLKAMGK